MFPQAGEDKDRVWGLNFFFPCLWYTPPLSREVCRTKDREKGRKIYAFFTFSLPLIRGGVWNKGWGEDLGPWIPFYSLCLFLHPYLQTFSLIRTVCGTKGNDKSWVLGTYLSSVPFSPPLVPHSALVKGGVCYQRQGRITVFFL